MPAAAAAVAAVALLYEDLAMYRWIHQHQLHLFSL